jgi:outer membrane protein TolC
MTKITKFFAVIIVFFACCGICVAQELITLNDYITQVSASNPEVKAINAAIYASDSKVTEANMVYSPYLSAGASYVDDKGGVEFGSTLPTDEMQAFSWNAGLSKKYASGSLLTLGYTDSRAKFDLLSPVTLIGPTLYSEFTGYEVKPFLKLEQSLIKDLGFGQTRAGIKKAKETVRSAQYLMMLKKQQITLQAKQAYLALSLAREVVEFRRSSLERAERILKWNEDRYKIDLVDKSDFLQAQAAYKLRKLNLDMAIEDETTACRDFNELRNAAGEGVGAQLEKLPALGNYYLNVTSITRSGSRADVLSAEAALRSSRMSEIEARYRTGPEVSVYGLTSFHGIGLDYGDTLKQAFTAKAPAYTVGINLAMPLDSGTVKGVKNGYSSDVTAAEESLVKAKLSERSAWEELNKRWDNIKIKYASAVEIRDIQNERVQEEQKKFERGRTSTFQLLSAQNDLDDSVLNVYRLTMEGFLIYSQADLYNTAPLAE